jgi:hypothetical protein
MSDPVELSMWLSDARKQIKKAHRVPETWTEDMEHTAEAIDSLGIQHYGRAGEDMPTRIIEAQVRAMADLTFAYAEQAYEAKDGELTFFDDGQREQFHEHLDQAHDAAMTALRQIEADE